MITSGYLDPAAAHCWMNAIVHSTPTILTILRYHPACNQDVIFELADYFLCVVNDFTSLDQRYLDKLEP